MCRKTADDKFYDHFLKFFGKIRLAISYESSVMNLHLPDGSYEISSLTCKDKMLSAAIFIRIYMVELI